MDQDIEGQLIELDSKKNVIGPRYCIVDSRSFRVYANKDKKQVIKEIDFGNIINAFPRVSGEDPIVEINLTMGRLLYFKAQNRRDAQLWSIALLRDPLTSEQLNIDDFVQNAIVGRGLTSKVVRALYKKDDKVYALKSIKKDKLLVGNDGKRAFKERDILKKLNSPFIIQIFGSFQTDKRFYLMLEYAAGGDLRKYMSEFGLLSLEHIKIIVAEIVVAITYLHEYGFIYRDLKPENVLLTEKGHIKLTDFGMASETINTISSTMGGTHDYIAPEVFTDRKYSRSVDWWSLGVLLYELVHGRRPFSAPNPKYLASAIINGAVNFDTDIEPATKSLITALLEKNPAHRLGTKCDNDVKDHLFFDGIDWDLLESVKYDIAFTPCPEEKVQYMNEITESFNNEDLVLHEVSGFTWTAEPYVEM